MIIGDEGHPLIVMDRYYVLRLYKGRSSDNKRGGQSKWQGIDSVVAGLPKSTARVAVKLLLRGRESSRLERPPFVSGTLCI